METETTDLAKSEPGELQAAPPSPLMGIIAAASTDGNVDADKLMKLLEADERYEKRQAKKAFVVSMASFKADPPKILKDKNVSYPTKTGSTTFNHATLGNVVETIGQALTTHGLTASWQTDYTEKGAVEVTCNITHILGHSESCRLQSAPDGSGGKNSIQAIGSAVTYLQRYTLLALCGLATYEDDDGNGAGKGAKGPPDPSDKEKGFLDKMCDLMLDSVPEGMTLDRDRVRIVTYAKATAYPYNDVKASLGAQWLIDELDKSNSWETVCVKP